MLHGMIWECCFRGPINGILETKSRHFMVPKLSFVEFGNYFTERVRGQAAFLEVDIYWKKYRLTHPYFKIQELFPERVAVQLNKQVGKHKFVYMICKTQDNISHILN